MPRLIPRSRHTGRFALGTVLAVLVVVLWPSAPAPHAGVGSTGTALRAAQDAGPSTGQATGRIAEPGATLGAARILGRLSERPTPLAPGLLTGYRWPLARGRITLPFKQIPGGTRIKDGHLFHDGVDMATFCGDRVVAAHDGTVLAAGRHFDDVIGWVGDLRPYYALLDRRHMWPDLPNVVVTDDGNGYRSMYAHFAKVVVRAGQHVRAGQLIGYEGATGHASGCHVHYGLFSPFETATFGVRQDIVHRLRTPTLEIARIDPLLVLPDGAEALRTRHVPGERSGSAGPSTARPGSAS